MTKTTKKILIYGVPAAVVLTIILLLALKKKKAVDNVVHSPLPESKAGKTVASDFPLKKGSKNNSVKVLQEIVGTNADGDFGPKTEAALKAFAGVTVVNNQAELDNLASKKASMQNQSAAIQRAALLYNQYKQTGGRIYVTADGYMNQYVQDQFYAINYTGKRLILKKGSTLPDYYTIINTTQGGNLEINVAQGENAGTYVVNPDIVSLVK